MNMVCAVAVLAVVIWVMIRMTRPPPATAAASAKQDAFAPSSDADDRIAEKASDGIDELPTYKAKRKRLETALAKLKSPGHTWSKEMLSSELARVVIEEVEDEATENDVSLDEKLERVTAATAVVNTLEHLNVNERPELLAWLQRVADEAREHEKFLNEEDE